MGEEIETTSILGVPVSAVTMQTTLDRIEAWIQIKSSRYVCVRDVASLMLAQSDPIFKKINQSAGLVLPDGMPLVWISRLRGAKNTERVCGPDLFPALCARSINNGNRHFFYGGKEGVAKELASKMSEKFPGLVVAGTACPPFLPPSLDVDEQAVSMINAAKPDIVWVGISSPKQEYWMSAHLEHLDAPVLIGVGAAFDFHSGKVQRAPKWMQRNGVEWVHRLFSEPRRLWRRYLILAPRFVVLAGWEVLMSGFQKKSRLSEDKGK